ncbi:MAG: pilin [Rhodanobacter sp.]
MKSMQKGFTLIELMIVVAIIAILAAIAIPQYQTYVIRSQVTRVVAETGDMKVAIEDCLNNGGTAWGTPASCVDTSTSSDLISTNNGHPTGAFLAAPETISATLGNHANNKVSGGTVTWSRTSSGAWTCKTAGNITPTYAPASCQN